MAQLLRPNSTNLITGWVVTGAATAHEAIDDVTADDDSTRIASLGGPNQVQCGIQTGTDPLSSSNHTIFVRATTNATASIAVSLVEGASTVRANFFIPSLTTSYADYTYTLSGAEADSITDYSDLKLWFGVVSTSGQVRITQSYFSIPDAPTRRVFIIS